VNGEHRHRIPIEVQNEIIALENYCYGN